MESAYYNSIKGAKRGTEQPIRRYEIDFSNQANVAFMPSPMIVSSYIPEQNQINVSIIVYLPLTVPEPTYDHLFGLFNVNPSGLEQLQFFVVTNYDSSIAESLFIGYQFDFGANPDLLPPNVGLEKIVTTQAFLWNEDPKTSRGTVTTVSRAAH
jgi:hypothetical protein